MQNQWYLGKAKFHSAFIGVDLSEYRIKKPKSLEENRCIYVLYYRDAEGGGSHMTNQNITFCGVW